MSVGMEQGAAEPKSDQDMDKDKDKPPRAGRRWRLALISLFSLFAVLACYDLVAASGEIGKDGAVPRATPILAASTPDGAVSSAAPPATAVLSPSPTARTLPVTSVSAFGPRGTADGDNPSIVSRINEAGAQPWYSSWYATPGFGNLQPGTGLLLDMGKPVTVSRVRLLLGSPLGADIQVWVGNSATMSGLSDVAGASDAGGAVGLTVAPSSTGRYVLVWFTRLPPNGTRGQYQVDVYGVTVDGTDL